MSIIEGINQYQNNTASNTQTMNVVKDTIRPTSAYLQELTPGKVFEGTVLDIKNGQVTIGLNDGQTITARMENGVQLEKGMPMLFEVRANSGEQIAIHPVNWESAQNPTLLKALEAAGLKVTQQNLFMVSEMMKEQMPIDKSSLLQMSRLISRFPETEVQTLLQMQKAGIEINDSTIVQFENYRNNQQAFLPEMRELMDGIPKIAEQLYANEQGNVVLQGGAGIQGQSALNAQPLLQFQQQIVGILVGAQTGADGSAQAAVSAAQTMGAAVEMAQNEALANLSVAQVDATEGVIIHQDLTQEESGIGTQTQSENGLANGLQNGLLEDELPTGEKEAENSVGKNIAGREASTPELAKGDTLTENAANGRNLNQILSSSQQANLTSLLQEFSGAVKNEILFQNGQLNPELTAGELLQQIVASVENSENYTSAAMQKLFFSDEYKEVLKCAMEEQWLTTPENLKEEGVVKELYQRLGRQMEQLQQVLNQTGTSQGAALAKSAGGVQSNLEFMNQLNQMYTYVQLPLKLQNQNAHSDLYVYTNKKSLMERDGELTALLHLDMEHLGATDIYIKMLGSSVETTFYLENISSYDVILNHMDVLQKKLEEKGYQCKIGVENREKQQDFVEEFLEKEKPIGRFQRYSFDVKA